MRSSKVRLYIRIRLEGKDVYADPVLNKNGSLREGYALVDNRAISHAEGVYYLRYASPGRGRRWESVGRFAEAAIAAKRRKEHALQGAAIHPHAPDTLGIQQPAIASTYSESESPRWD